MTDPFEKDFRDPVTGRNENWNKDFGTGGWQKDVPGGKMKKSVIGDKEFDYFEPDPLPMFKSVAPAPNCPVCGTTLPRLQFLVNPMAAKIVVLGLMQKRWKWSRIFVS